MEQYITLIGTERVEHAAREMAAAAYKMQQAAESFAYSLQNLDRLVERYEAAVAHTA